jgi:hypothetical protein
MARLWRNIAPNVPPIGGDSPLAILGAFVAHFPAAQAKDPALAADTLLSTHVAALGEAFREMVKGLEQFTPVGARETVKWIEALDMGPTIGGFILWFSKLAVGLIEDDDLVPDRKLDGDLDKLLDAFTALHECYRTLMRASE